jgi:hypothetical protein
MNELINKLEAKEAIIGIIGLQQIYFISIYLLHKNYIGQLEYILYFCYLQYQD